MSKKNFDIYLEFNYSKLNLAAFNKLNSQLEHYKEQSYKSYINSDQELNFDELQKLVEINIIEMEKSIDEFVKNIYLIIETPQTMSIQLSVIKNNEGKNITEQDALYLIQDAKQQILKSRLDIRILHIIVENYVYDNMKYKFLPLEKKCKKFSIDVKFVCFPKNLLKNFEIAETECKFLLEKKLPLPAYDQCLKASHIFNLLDARGVIGVAQRTEYISRIRELAKGSGQSWLESQK